MNEEEILENVVHLTRMYAATFNHKGNPCVYCGKEIVLEDGWPINYDGPCRASRDVLATEIQLLRCTVNQLHRVVKKALANPNDQDWTDEARAVIRDLPNPPEFIL